MSETTRPENLRPGWKRGQSGNPKGRPRGSRNRVTLVALAAMEEGAEAIARKVVDLAIVRPHRIRLPTRTVTLGSVPAPSARQPPATLGRRLRQRECADGRLTEAGQATYLLLS